MGGYLGAPVGHHGLGMRWVAAVTLIASVATGCGSEDVPSSAAAGACAPTADLRLVHTGEAGEEGGDLFGLTVDGEVRRLTDDGGSYDPAFSPDGSRIAFSSIGEDGSVSDGLGATGLDLHVMAADGSSRRRLLDGDDDGAPAWSPDGELIAFTRGGRILVVEPDDPDDPTSARVLVEGDEDTYDSDPAFSPDGTQVVFVRSAAEDGLRSFDAPHHLMIVDVAGSDARTIRTEDRLLGSPSWSLDATALAFTLGGPGERIGAIAVLDLGNGSVEVVGEPAVEPVWSTSGRLYGYGRAPAVADFSGGWRVAEFEPGDDGFSSGRRIEQLPPIGFLYSGVGVDVPRCIGPETPELTSDDDRPEMLRVTDPTTGDHVEVMTREAAQSRFAQREPGRPDGPIEAKLVDSRALGPGAGLDHEHVGGLVWIVAGAARPPAPGDNGIFDARTGDFLMSGADVAWTELIDLAP